MTSELSGNNRLAFSGKLTISHLRPKPIPEILKTIRDNDGEGVEQQNSEGFRPPPLLYDGKSPRPLSTTPRNARQSSKTPEPKPQIADPTESVPQQFRGNQPLVRGTDIPFRGPPTFKPHPFDNPDHPIHRFHALASAKWPAVFTPISEGPDAKRPLLALEVRQQINNALAQDFTPQEIKMAMRAWTRLRGYLNNMVQSLGERRHRLDGSLSDLEQDVVKASDIEWAKTLISHQNERNTRMRRAWYSYKKYREKVEKALAKHSLKSLP